MFPFRSTDSGLFRHYCFPVRTKLKPRFPAAPSPPPFPAYMKLGRLNCPFRGMLLFRGALRHRIATEQALASSRRSAALFGPAGRITGVQASLLLSVCRPIQKLKTSKSPSFTSSASDVAPCCVLERVAINDKIPIATRSRWCRATLLHGLTIFSKNHQPAYSRAPRENRQFWSLR